MAYRTITVDDKDYQYTVGRSHVKVRGFETALLEMVGKIRKVYDGPFDEYYWAVSVRPTDIAAWIRSKKN